MFRYSVIVTLLFVLLFSINNASAQIGDGSIPPGFKFGSGVRIPLSVMPAIPRLTLQVEDSINDLDKGKPYRFGYNHYTNLSIANSGTWTTLPSGERMWLLQINSPGALSINLTFANFHLPPGARLYVYSLDHQHLLGGFTDKDNHSDGLFGTELINSENVVVEYIEPAAVAGQGFFTIYRVTHGYRNVGDYAKSFGDAGTCEINAICPIAGNWQVQKRAVVCLVTGGNEFCSGSLVNNTRNDGTPYILSANHCGTANGAWVYRFNWETTTCTNPSTNPTSQSISGGTAIANNAGSDFALSRMSSVPPSNYNVFYAGWSNLNVVADSAVGIHHPAGDVKKISFARSRTTSSTYNSASTWQTGTWIDGVTEGGSSGSPLFDQNHRIIGQLYGGPSSCGASTANRYDHYGKFAVSWNTGTTAATRLRDWLDPDNTGATVNDGYDPNQPTLALDVSVQSITSPTGNSCSTSYAPVVVIKNRGTSTITSATITYRLDNTASQIYNWAGSLASTQTASITLPLATAAIGTHTFTFSVSAPNGLADGDTSNNTGTSTFTVVNSNAFPLPLFEGFQSTTFPPTGWTLVNADNDVTWVRTTTAGGFGTSTASARIDQYSPTATTAGTKDNLLTPFLNFSTISAPAYITFNVAYARYDATHYDSLVILASIDCGSTWTRIYAKGSTGLATRSDLASAFTPTAAQWRKDSIPLNNYVGQTNVQFDFQFISGWGNIGYIDDINIKGYSNVKDAALTNVAAPSGAVCGTTISPNVTLRNNSANDTLRTATITYLVDNGTTQSFAWTGTLAPTQSTSVSLPNLVSTAGTHTFTAIVSSPNGGADGNNANDTTRSNFTINAYPSADLGADITQCGGSVTLAPNTTATTYQWSTGTNTATVSTTASGTYSVTVTAAGCSTADTINVTINPVPVASLGADFGICTNPVTLDAGNPGATYLWSHGETTQTLTVTNAGVYSVTVTNTFNCTVSDTIIANANTPPTVALGRDIDQCGETIILNAGNTGATYVWSEGSSAQTLSVISSNTYSVTVTTTGGCVASDTINVFLKPNPVVNLDNDTSACGSLSLTVGAQGGVYTWSNGANTQNISITSSGIYGVTVTNADGCTATDSIDVTIHALPIVSLNASSNTLCSNDSVHLTGTPAGGVYAGVGLTNNEFIPDVTLVGIDTLIYTYSDTNGCVGRAYTAVHVDLCTGIANTEVLGNISVYPNPITSKVFIHTDKTYTGVSNIELTAINGIVIYRVQANDLSSQTDIQLDASLLPSAVYLLRITNQEQTKVVKLVKE